MSANDSILASTVINQPRYPLCKKVFLILAATVFSILVSLSRFVLGTHSLDQIIFG
jgi:hypothetical protein